MQSFVEGTHNMEQLDNGRIKSSKHIPKGFKPICNRQYETCKDESGRGYINISFKPLDNTDSRETLACALERFARLRLKRKSNRVNRPNLTALFNDWVCGVTILEKQTSRAQERHNQQGDRTRYVERNTYVLQFMDGMLRVNCSFKSFKFRNLQEIIYEAIIMELLSIPQPQMEDDGGQGDTTQDSDKAGNTIITRDADQSVAKEEGIAIPQLISICSTEPMHQFESITNRWMALPSIEVKTSDAFNTILQTYNLPSFLYSENSAPNMMPFENFMFGKYDIWFKFVVNANKFHVGKVLASVKYDSYQIDTLRNSLPALVSRPHVMMDLAANNEGMLCVPFKYHRTFVRNASLANSQYGSKAAQYASVVLSIMSPLAAAVGAPSNMYIRPFYAIKKASFTGMSYKIPVVQMETAGAVVSMLDKGLKICGAIKNMDKPYDDQRVQQVILRPRMNFQTGVGASDSVPLRLDPLAQTTYLPDHEYPDDPTTVLDIAKIWGFAGAFTWKASSTEGSELFNIPIEPTWRNRDSWAGVPTPLEYISSMYQFWSGPLEVRLDFVSNAFHTGSIMLSAEFGRASTNVEQSGSTYTKVFHLGNQKTVSFVIPYIYDTVWRRTSTVPFSVLRTNLDASARSGQISTMRANSSAFKVRVINKLVPVQSVVQDIQVLVFIRAADTFTLHSPIMSNMLNSEQVYALQDFPGNYPLENVSELSKISLTDSVREPGAVQVSHKWMKGQTPDQIQNAILVTNEGTILSSNPDHPLIDPKNVNTAPDSKIESGIIAAPNPASKYFWVNSQGSRITYNPSILPPDDYQHVVLPDFEAKKDAYYWNTARTRRYRYNRTYRAFDIGGGVWMDQPAFAQMDDGVKEDTDPTETFQIGTNRNNVQTVESHIRIKDILRRPVCIVSHFNIPAYRNVAAGATLSVNPFFVPCLPPSHMITYGTSANRIFTPLIGRSAHTHLLDLFRFWRGSQRYSIISHRITGAPIYAVYVPHSGAMNCGTVTFLTVDLLDTNCPPSSFGLATEVMIPSVNPTMSIEVPYETENNWTLMQCENWERNFSWRDHGDYNVGHIVLWSEEAFTCDIFWSAGDDFEVKNFLGPPPVLAPFSKFALSDNHPSSQMEDFSPRERPSLARSIYDRISTPLACAGAAQIPVIGTAVATGIGAYKLGTTIANIEDKVGETTNNVNNLIHNADDLVSMIKQKLSTGLNITNNIYTAVVNGIIDLLTNMGRWDFKAISLSILRLIINTINVPLTSIASYIPEFQNLFRRSPTAQAEDSIEQISESFWNEQNVKDAFKLICSIVGTAIGAVLIAPSNLPTDIIKSILTAPFRTTTVVLANGILRFADITFNIIKQACLWVASYFDPRVRIVQELRLQSPVINDFMKESQILTNEINRSAMQLPAFRLRYWVNVVKAYEIQRRVIDLPRNAVSPVLVRMCADVIKHGKENMADLRCSPVKYEPYVLVIHGPAGIGKSNLVTHLAKEMLAAIGLTRFQSDPVHIRSAGSKHWNTYSDQPVVVYDDWLNITSPELVASTLNELYQLKSCATFVPEQAAIEDKKIKATPRLVILLCNNAYPDSVLTNMVSCKDAVYRRRELTVHCARKPEYENRNLREMSDEESLSMAHLLFRQDKGFDSMNLSKKAVGYTEFKKFAIESFKEYDNQERRNVRQRLDKLMGYFSTTPCDIRDPFAVFYEGCAFATQDDMPLRSEMLEHEIRQVAGVIETARSDNEALNLSVHNPWSEEVRAQMIAEAACLLSVGTAAIGGLYYCLRKLGSYNASEGLEAQCNICLETTKIHYVCGASYSMLQTRSLEGVHKFCRTCVNRVQSVGPWSCAVCRNNAEPVLVMPQSMYESISVLSRLHKASNWATNVIGNFINEFDRVVGVKNWGMFLLGCSYISSINTRVRLNGGDNYPYLMIYNASTAILSSVCFPQLYRFSRLTPATRTYIDLARTKLIDNIPSFSPEAEAILARILEYNNSVSNNQFVPEATRTNLERDITELVRHRLGDNFTRYIRPIKGLFFTEEIATLSANIEQYNVALLANPNEWNEELYNSLIARIPPTAQNDSDEEDDWSMPLRIGARRVNHFSVGLQNAQDYYPYTCDVTKWTGVAEFNIICPHKHFVEHKEHILYERGNYFWNSVQGEVPIKDGWCSNYPECPMAPGNREPHLLAYFEQHKNLWFGIFINKPPHVQKQFIEQLVPRFAWPQWIMTEQNDIENPILETSSWWDYLNVHPMLVNVLKVAAVGTVTIGILAGSYSLFRWLFPTPESQIIPSGDSVIRHFRARAQQITRVPASQSEFMDVIVDKINNNYFVIIVVENQGNERHLIGCGVKQRLGIMPKHYYEYICKKKKEEGVQFFLAKPHLIKQRVQIAIDEADFTYSATADICLYQLPASWNMFRDITKYMSLDADLQKKMANNGVIVKPPLKSNNYTSVIPVDIKGYVKNQFIMGENGGFNSQHCLKYTFSQKGACGSMVLKDQSQRPIVAMHIAGIGEGVSGIGYGVILTDEMFAEFQCEVSGKCAEHEEPPYVEEIDTAKMHLPEDSVVGYVGVLPNNLKPFSPFKSKIKPSLIQDLLPWTTTKAPAILSQKDERYTHTISPLVAGCAKHGYLTANFTTSQLHKVRDLRFEQLRRMKPGISPCNRLTVEEAIIGFAGIEFYDPLHLDTSAGWPLCTSKKTLKKDWCDIERDESGVLISCKLHPEVANQIESETNKRRRGIVPFTVFVDTLKDEKKPLAKIHKLGGTRVFCASPFAYTVAMRQNFLHMCAAYSTYRWELKHAVGINLQGPQCTELVSRLLRVGHNIVTIDYSNFGPGYNAGVAEQAAQNFKKWTLSNVAGVNEAELDCLLEEGLNSLHCMNNVLYRQQGGSPSGSPITVIINSEVNIMYIMLAWDALVKGEGKWRDFEEQVCMYVYGDDLIMSVSDNYIEHFNAVTITEFFKKHKIVATNADKSTEIKPYETIETATFLKCNFVPHPYRSGEWLAKLDIESVNDTPMWIKEPIAFKEATELNAEAGVRAAFGHGKEFFNNYRTNINIALNQIKSDPILLDWHDIDDSFYGEGSSYNVGQ
nr:putative polyprotein [La Jolla virus]